MEGSASISVQAGPGLHCMSIDGIKRDENISVLGARAESDRHRHRVREIRTGSSRSIVVTPNRTGTVPPVLSVAYNRVPVIALIYGRCVIFLLKGGG